MRIVPATFGSRGDVQPMSALSLVLKEAGHDVLFAPPRPWELMVKNHLAKACASEVL